MADLMLTENDKSILKTIRQNPGKTQSFIADLSDIKAWSTAKGYIDGLFSKNMIVNKMYGL